MTDDEYKYWLEHGTERAILVEIETDDPIYLSNVNYVTAPTDTPANRYYMPVIAGGVSLNQSLPFSGAARLSYGDIEIHNEDGSFDWLLTTVVEKRSISIYYGAPNWPREDFRLQVAGVVAKVSSRQRGRLNIILQDALSELNIPVMESTVGGSGPNADVLMPIALGEVHNVAPVLIDPATHQYRVHPDAIERIIEVRDNGAPIESFTADLPNGTFVLTKSPAGTITASIQGDKTGGLYINTIAALIERVVVKYGGWDPLKIDQVNFLAFAVDHPMPVGWSVTERRTILQVCQDLAASVGAQLVVSRTGLLRLVKIDFPVNVLQEIRPEDYERGSLRLAGEPDIVAAVKLAYCRNWTVQDSLVTGIAASSHDLFRREWLTVSEISTPTATTYRLPVDVPEEQTALLRTVDAEAEAERRLDLWKVPRRVFSLKGFAHLIPLEPGDGVRLYFPGLGLASGREGVVIAAKPDWSNATTDLEVLV